MLIGVAIVAIIGFFVSWYGYRVEQKVHQQASYKAACDLSDTVSCTKPFMTPYAKLFFGISNTVVGMLFYVGMTIVALLGWYHVALLGALAGSAMSVVFAYILYAKIKALCLICSTIYVINFLLLVAVYYSW